MSRLQSKDPDVRFYPAESRPDIQALRAVLVLSVRNPERVSKEFPFVKDGRDVFGVTHSNGLRKPNVFYCHFCDCDSTATVRSGEHEQIMENSRESGGTVSQRASHELEHFAVAARTP